MVNSVRSPQKCFLVLCAVFVSFSMVSGASRNGFDMNMLRIGSKNNWTWPLVQSAMKTVTDLIVGGNLKMVMNFTFTANLTPACEEALFKSYFALRKSERWVIDMLDATGKPPSGILRGTVMDFGSFEQCIQLRVNASKQQELFRGKYCMVGYYSPLFASVSKPSEIAAYVSKYGKPPDWILEPMKKGGNFMKNMGFWFGTCVPSTCSVEDIKKVANAVAEPLGFTARVADCQIEEERKWHDHEIAAVTVLVIIGVFVLLGTIADIISRYSVDNLDARAKIYSQESWALRCCKLFSVCYNTERMLKMSCGPLSVFHGIRFFSATWIILGHTYFYENRWQFIKFRNLIGVPENFGKYLPVAVIENFTIPVGSFFFLSGFLLTYTNWTKVEKGNGTFNVLKFFCHKFWRIAPALMMTIVLFLAMPLIGSGPLWYTTLDPETDTCKFTWWRSLLFISNLFDSTEVCLVHTWYLSALMQFHVIAVVLLLVGRKWPIVGGALGLVLLVICTVITALKMIWHDFPMPANGIMKDPGLLDEYMTHIYMKPFAHFSSYWIGMIFGLLVLKYRHVKITGVYMVTGWLLAVSCGLLTVYGIYGPAHHVEVRAVYVSLHRIGWALSLGWITMVCASGSGGFVNRLLSWKAFQPLGHLSYLAYLMHPLVITFREASLRERVYYGHTELVFAFLSNVVVSYFLAYLLYVTVELPFASLEMMTCNAVKKPTFGNGCHAKDAPGISTISVKPCRQS